MAKISPFKFLQEVRAEARRSPGRPGAKPRSPPRMVFVMVAIASIFFLIADQVMRFVVDPRARHRRMT